MPRMLVLALLVSLSAWAPASAEEGAALSGHVAARGEGPLEGVIVSAKRAGGTITVSVITDAAGLYRFPASRMPPGRYALAIRATGYDLNGPREAEIAAGAEVRTDLDLVATRNLPGQLTNAEWLASAPGPLERKAALLSCLQCHTFERIFRSTHDFDEFTQVITRMEGYASVSFWLQPQLRAERRKAPDPEQHRRQAEYLASVNLSAAPAWNFPLKPFPRATGRATRAIITEYDLPRRTSQPHDVMLDADGMAWYTDFGREILGRLDPATGAVTEYPVPAQKPGAPTGSLDLESDKDGNLWIAMMYQGAIGRFDRKTGSFQVWKLPPELDSDSAQLNMVTNRVDLDGRVWTNNDDGSGSILRLDTRSGAYEKFQPLLALPGGAKAHKIYDVLADSHNNAWLLDIGDNYIGRIDAKTGEARFWQVPSAQSHNRRGRIGADDRLVFAEYLAGKVGLFDPASERIQEFALASPWSGPYDAALDRNGEIWAAGMSTDRVSRVDPRTGAVVEYPMPRDTNTRRVFVDNRSNPVAFWTGSNHSAVIVKVEPLD